MRTLVSFIFGLLLFAMTTLWTWATFAAPTTSVMSAEEQAALAQRWSGTLQVQNTKSLYNRQDGSQVSTLDTMGELGYKMTKNYTLSFHVEGSQDLQHQEDSDVGVASIGLSHAEIPLEHKLFLLTPSTSLRIPVSRGDERASFITALTAKIKTAMNPDYLFSKKWDVSVSLKGTRYVHTYEQAENGDLNTEYKFVQSFNTAWNFTDWFALAFEFDHFNAWDYQGVQRESYAHSEEMDFTLNKHWAVALGYQYGNPMVSVWAPNQQDYNFKLADEQNSLVYGQVNYTF